jgi:FkbM family methyltransferase
MKLKHTIKLFFGRVYGKIRSGPLKGKKWSIASGNKFIRGDYEQYKTDAFLEHYTRGSIFFDIGAHIGYFSSIAALINNGNGRIFAFEPRPMNIKFFRKHIEVNNFQNVSLIEAAAGPSDGYVGFDDNHGSATGFVSKEGNLKVKQVSIGRMIKDGSLPVPDFIKIDVEGGEIDVLEDLSDVISSSRPKMLVATHSKECRDFTEDFLNKNNYSFRVLNPEAVSGDTEIIAIPG